MKKMMRLVKGKGKGDGDSDRRSVSSLGSKSSAAMSVSNVNLGDNIDLTRKLSDFIFQPGLPRPPSLCPELL